MKALIDEAIRHYGNLKNVPKNIKLKIAEAERRIQEVESEARLHEPPAKRVRSEEETVDLTK
jgi:hypothetical protein